MTEHYSSRACTLEVEDDDKSIQCDLCDRWIHIKCAEINHQKYERLKNDPLAWYCADCTVNICSIAPHIEKLKLFVSLIKTKFDIICISESRITKNNSLTTNVNIPGYNFEHTLTKSKAGGSLIYISDKISYKLHNDLNNYCSKQLESVFSHQILIPNKQNQLIGTVYKHPIVSSPLKLRGEFLFLKFVQRGGS